MKDFFIIFLFLPLSVNFIGSPALPLNKFQEYKERTIVGASLRILVPAGQYFGERIVNLGSNRWTFKPQIGVSRRVYQWVFEGYAGVWLFTPNSDLLGKKMTQEPIFTLKGHICYIFKKGIWIAIDGGYGLGGQTTVDELPQGTQKNVRVGATLSLPVARQHALKLNFTSGIDISQIQSLYSMKYIVKVFIVMAISLSSVSAQTEQGTDDFLFNDSHFHLTNYIQEGITAERFLEIMDTKVGRSTLFGIPLQQQWSYDNSGTYAPSYYLQSDAPLYYYSFTDAYIAMQYKSITQEQQARLAPMITGFNPSDMYAAKHIERVLRTFPGVFTGIGEFSIHKEFVSSKISGEVASLTNPALDSLLEFAGKVGLIVILHNDMDMPMAKDKAVPVYLEQMKALLRKHPNTTIIWAHVGLGRIVHPAGYGSSASPERSSSHIDIVEELLDDPAMSHLYFDISWDEVAKYIVATPQTIENSARLFNKYPDRFLFGTDVVAPPDQDFYLAVFEIYAPLWKDLSNETSEKIRIGNYERLFDEARKKVRAWEKENIDFSSRQ